MADRDDPGRRDRWARLRFAIVGPLLAAPPAAGDLHPALRELAARTWRHPNTGEAVRFGVSTIERWYYAARGAQTDPVGALKTQVRSDAGCQRSLGAALVAAIQTQYRAHPGWTVQLHYDNLVAQLGAAVPSYPTVLRFFRAQGLERVRRVRRPSTAGAPDAATVKAPREVRSYEVEHVNGLWHLDFHHGSRRVLTAAGQWVKPLALAVMDDRSRLVCHLQWFTDETTRSLVHGFSQALLKRDLPRSLLTDNGAAMVSEEFVAGLHTLGIVHETTLPYAAYQNGKQETFWASLEGRLMAMLEAVQALTLAQLNEASLAWVEQEYHRAAHRELGTSPLARFLAGPNVSRPAPNPDTLRRAFRMEVARTQRRSDGTVTVDGVRFEVPASWRHVRRLHLRLARWDLSTVDLVDARDGTVLAALYPLDRARNAEGLRRALAAAATQPTTPPPAAGAMAPLLRRLMAEYAATGLPPAYLPLDESTSAPASLTTTPTTAS
jgi:transposase InsO family protein